MFGDGRIDDGAWQRWRCYGQQVDASVFVFPQPYAEPGSDAARVGTLERLVRRLEGEVSELRGRLVMLEAQQNLQAVGPAGHN
jgi:hypothetical protein